MKRITFFCPLLLSLLPVSSAIALPFPLPLNKQSEIIKALDHGLPVSFSIDLSYCTPEVGTLPSSTRGGSPIEGYRLANDVLSFAEAKLVVEQTTGKPIQQVMRYSVYKNGNVHFEAYLYDVPTFVQKSKFSYNCSINSGVNFYLNWS